VLGGTVTLDEGENVTCTMTNDDVAPTLTLVKSIVNDDGGDAVVSDFPLFINGDSVTSGVPNILSANTLYTATETNLAGFTASVWGGDCNPDGTITLNEGENKTCTITNNDVAPTLKLVKEVTNNDGGNAVADDWTLSAVATAPFDGRNFSNTGGSGVFQTVFANQGYDLFESVVPGYTAGSWNCNGGTLVGSTLTLDEGQTGVTCTITNDDIAPTLTLVKNVVNDNGGNAEPDDFNLTIGGNPALSGVAYTLSANTPYEINETLLSGYTFVDINGDPECPAILGGTATLDEGENVTCTITNDDVAPTLTLIKIAVNNDGGDAVTSDFPLFINGSPVTSGVSNTLTANTLYTVTETTLTGYTPSVWGGDCAPGGTITLNEGENKTCTITNDDVAPTVKLVKLVDNGDGGNAFADDWTLSAVAADPFADRNFSNLGGSGVFETVYANQGYDLSETSLPGYTAGTWSCTGGTLVGSTLTLSEGQTGVTCTITNDDVAPKLTLVKDPTNDDGGNALPDDFLLTIGGTPATSGTEYTLSANTPYAINETQLPGYTFVSITGDPKCPAALGGTITLDEGDDITCTITNDDVAPKLTLIKYVTNDDGGDAVVADFPLFINGNAVTSGVANTLMANTLYTASETTLTGYTPSVWGGDCAANGTITLNEGDNKTCTITNDDVAPTLTIVKTVVGTQPPSGGWTFSGSGVIGEFNLPAVGGTHGPTDVLANMDYTITEQAIGTGDPSTKWVLTAISCSDGTNGSLVNRNVAVNLALDEDVTCSFTNMKEAINIVKKTVGSDGSEGDNVFVLTGALVTWKYYVTNTGSVPLSNVAVVDSVGGVTPAYLSGDTNSNGKLDLTETWVFTATGTNNTPIGTWYNNTGSVTGTYTDSDNQAHTVTDSDNSGYYSQKPGVVTNSMLCDFGESFRLIFTPDVKYYTSSTPAYKLSDSNPGQFFYNVFQTGGTGTVTLTLPFPFVTQGATPIHVYSSLTAYTSNGQTCLQPTGEIKNYNTQVTLSSYVPANTYGATKTVTLTGLPTSGFMYINIHLDYGLEKLNGWIKSGANANYNLTINPTMPKVNIVNNTKHTFTSSIANSTDWIYNANEFKKVKGFGGLVYIKTGMANNLPVYEGLEGATVQLWKGSTLIETMTTDVNGWYLSAYVHKGTTTTYTVKVLANTGHVGSQTFTYPTQTQSVTAGGANKFGEGNFQIIPVP
jgi:hypothetical protein